MVLAYSQFSFDWETVIQTMHLSKFHILNARLATTFGQNYWQLNNIVEHSYLVGISDSRFNLSNFGLRTNSEYSWSLLSPSSSSHPVLFFIFVVLPVTICKPFPCELFMCRVGVDISSLATLLHTFILLTFPWKLTCHHKKDLLFPFHSSISFFSRISV